MQLYNSSLSSPEDNLRASSLADVSLETTLTGFEDKLANVEIALTSL